MAGAAVGSVGETFPYVYDESGQLIKVIDSTGTVIEYVYDEVGNIVEIKRTTMAGLAIFGFSPQQGPVGTVVTIQGQGFRSIPAENLVEFNGVPTPVASATESSVVAPVPPGATTGPVSVTVAAGSATSEDDFTVLPLPVITAVAPTLSMGGTVIAAFQVTGFNLGGSSFTFTPAFVSPALVVDSAMIGAGGASATLAVTVSPSAIGSFGGGCPAGSRPSGVDACLMKQVEAGTSAAYGGL